MRPWIDTPSATLGEADERRGRARCLGGSIGSLLTGRAQWFVDEARKGFGFCGTFASAFVGFGRCLRSTG